MATKPERKRPISIRSDINVELNTVRFWVFDHNTEKPVPGPQFDFRVDVNKVNPVLHRYAILDGIKDSIRDAGALPAAETLAAKFAAMRERAEYLESGAADWMRGRESAGENTLLVNAMARKFPEKERTALAAYVKSKDRKWRDQALNSPELREIVAEIRAEMYKDVRSEELFEGLDEI